MNSHKDSHLQLNHLKVFHVYILFFSVSYRMIKESGKNLTFNVAFHFLSEARLASDSLNTKRAKRLAQESVTLSSSLPLDYSSSVFLRLVHWSIQTKSHLAQQLAVACIVVKEHDQQSECCGFNPSSVRCLSKTSY